MLDSLKSFLQRFHETQSASLIPTYASIEQHPQETQTLPNYSNSPNSNPSHGQAQPNGHHAVGDTRIELDLSQSPSDTRDTRDTRDTVSNSVRSNPATDQLATENPLTALSMQSASAAQQLEYYLQQAERLTEVGQFETAADYYRQAIELQSQATSEEVEPEAVNSEDPDQVTELEAANSTLAEVKSNPGKTIRVTVAGNYPVVSIANPDAIEPASHSAAFGEIATQIQQARLLCDQKQWQRAIEVCQSAVQFLEPYSATTYRLLGLALQSQQRLMEAEQAYVKSLTLQPEIAETHARLGSVCAEQQRLEESIGFYEQALELDPKFAGAYLKLGAVWQQMGETTQAVDCWYQAAQLEPSWITVQEHIRLGNRLVEQNKLEEALWCYQQAIAFDANCAEAYYFTAEVLGQQGNWQAAQTHHHQATQLTPEVPKFHLGLGRSLTKLEQWQDAIACFQQVTTLDSSYPEIQEALQQLEFCQRALVAEFYYQQALKLSQQEQWQAAADASQKAIDRQPQTAKFQAILGQSLVKLRQWQPALDCYREAVRLAPKQVAYTKALIELLMQLGHLEEAARHYSKLLTPTPEQTDDRSIALEVTPVSATPVFAMF